MRVGLLAPRPDIGLYRQDTEIWFREVRFDDVKRGVWLPHEVVVNIECKNRMFRNRHRYSDYRLFTVETLRKARTSGCRAPALRSNAGRCGVRLITVGDEQYCDQLPQEIGLLQVDEIIPVNAQDHAGGGATRSLHDRDAGKHLVQSDRITRTRLQRRLRPPRRLPP